LPEWPFCWRNLFDANELISTYDLIESAEKIDIVTANRTEHVEQNLPHNQKKAKAEAKK
jgi:hypothetical protein